MSEYHPAMTVSKRGVQPTDKCCSRRDETRRAKVYSQTHAQYVYRKTYTRTQVQNIAANDDGQSMREANNKQHTSPTEPLQVTSTCATCYILPRGRVLYYCTVQKPSAFKYRIKHNSILQDSTVRYTLKRMCPYDHPPWASIPG